MPVQEDDLRKMFEGQLREATALPGDVRIYLLRPPSPRRLWIALVPGWISDPMQLQELMWQLFQDGYPVILVDSPAGVSTEPGGFSYPYLRRARAFLSGLERRGINRVAVITHADGSLVWAAAAKMIRHPRETFMGAILVEPAGLRPEMPWSLAWRTGQEALKNLRRHRENPAFFEVFWDQFPKNPARGTGYHWGRKLLWTLWQGWGMARMDIRQMLKALHAKGIPIWGLSGTASQAFPRTRVQAALAEDGIEVRTLHGEGNWSLFLRPAAVYGAIQPLLRRLEQRQ